MSRPILLTCQGLAKAYGTRVLFDDLSLGLFEGDHACLVGPNGSGKSTLLKILAGLEEPDRGTCALRGGMRVGYVAQDPAFPAGATVDDVVSHALQHVDEDARPGRLAQARGRAGFADGAAAVDALSGGFKKRLAIAQALAAEPDIVLMDEPTNHLDVDGILWLERLLVDHARAFLVVSHDRYFLEHVAQRVLELNRVHPGGVFASEGPYSEFLVRRDAAMRGQAAYEESLANTVRREIAWLRRGAKARSTKAKGRIKEAGRLMTELDDLRSRNATETAGIELRSSERRTRRLLVARGLTKSFDTRPLLRDIDLILTPGARVGLLGPNGSGKTTLLDLLAGTLAPDAGEIERAEGVRVVRFEQERGGLDPAQSLRRALAPEGDAVTFQDRSVHVASWAKRFLFRPEQLELPVGRLSGGEQARILIARLVREPADVLIVDEPTNDLDIPTLEVLEDSLAAFDGALVLVTHDRFMLERVSTVILALTGDGSAQTFADYAQWEVAHEARRSQDDAVSAVRPRAAASPRTSVPARPRRLSYLEQREMDGMERAIEEAETALEACRRAAEDPDIASDAEALQRRYGALEAARAEVDRLYARWAELDAKRA
jgi:ATP-binding cassette subfamily F protein uup